MQVASRACILDSLSVPDESVTPAKRAYRKLEAQRVQTMWFRHAWRCASRASPAARQPAVAVAKCRLRQAWKLESKPVVWSLRARGYSGSPKATTERSLCSRTPAPSGPTKAATRGRVRASKQA